MDKFLYRDEKFIAKWEKIRAKGFESYRRRYSFFNIDGITLVFLLGFLVYAWLEIGQFPDLPLIYPIVTLILIIRIIDNWFEAINSWDLKENRYQQ